MYAGWTLIAISVLVYGETGFPDQFAAQFPCLVFQTSTGFVSKAKLSARHRCGRGAMGLPHSTVGLPLGSPLQPK